MAFDRFVARRYLRAKRKQAFIGVISIITLVGITLGVAALNIALSIHNGMSRAFMQSLIGSTGQLYLMAGGLGGGFEQEELEQIVTLLEETPGVAAISMMRVEPGVVLSRRKQLSYTKLNGIIPQDHLNATDVLEQMDSGSPLRLANRPPETYPGILLGFDLARRLGVQTGDTIQVGVPRLSSPGLTMQGFKFRTLKCEVVGIFRSGNSQFDEVDAYLLLDELLRVLNERTVQTVLVRFDSVKQMDRAKASLKANEDLPPLTSVADLRDLNLGLLRALELEKIATTLVISLFILIVALNMISALTMLVMEKHRDIGIMKSFGTPSGLIKRIFIRQGMTLALRGTILGTLIGVTLAWVADSTRLIKLDNDVYEVLNYLPFEVRPTEVIMVAVGSLILSLATCIYPAHQAAKLDPVEALKYD